MDLKAFLDTPPWEWPPEAGKRFKEVLTNKRVSESDRVLAAELAGDFTVINDELAAILIGIARSADEPEQLRAKSAIALGAVLEYSDTDGFDDPDEAPITEQTFYNLQRTLRNLYFDESVPKEVRRRILEASVRASEDWHNDAIEKAYADGDREWMLTAVFAMGHVRGFDKQILEALNSKDAEIHLEAVTAAGNWEVDGAWSHVVGLIENPKTPKPLLLAAIGAAAGIRPIDSREFLIPLADSNDEEIAEAAEEALAQGDYADDEFDEDSIDEEGTEWIN